MNALKCDICGTFYEPYPMGQSMEYKIHERTEMYTRLPREKFDCCTACTRRILDFIDVLKQYPGVEPNEAYYPVPTTSDKEESSVNSY